jgi:hypothetical protein
LLAGEEGREGMQAGASFYEGSINMGFVQTLKRENPGPLLVVLFVLFLFSSVINAIREQYIIQYPLGMEVAGYSPPGASV